MVCFAHGGTRSIFIAFVGLSTLYLIFTTQEYRNSYDGSIVKKFKRTETGRKLYVVTPTYNRRTQIPDLVKMKQTLMHLSGVVWLLVEDANSTNATVAKRLASFNSGENRLVYLSMHHDTTSRIRGAYQRNTALSWIYNHTPHEEDAVVYFGDDDNLYDSEGLSRVQHMTEVASMFNVGLVQGVTEGPVVNGSKIVKINTCWEGGRTFPIDMAGFAINLRHMRKQASPYFKVDVTPGYQEDNFLKQQLKLTLSEFIPLTRSEEETFAWHTKTVYKVGGKYHT